MRSTIRRSGSARLLATLALAVPLTLGAAACSEDEGAGVVEEGVGEEGVGVEEEEDE